MSESNVVHDTFVIHRTFAKSAAKVYAAFAEPAKKRRWFAEGDTHDVLMFEMDFRPGGSEQALYRLNDRTPFAGVEIKHTGTFLDVVPDARVVIGSSMSFGGKPISASLITFEIVPGESGTTLVCTHQAVFFEGADGPQMRRVGMDELLDRLVKSLAGGGEGA